MADKAEKKPAAEKEKPEKAEKAEKSEGKAAKGGGGLFSKTPVLIGGAMVIEAIVLFAGFKMLGGGAKPAAANEVATATDTDTKSDSEKSSDKTEKPSSETAQSKGGEASGESAKPGETRSHDKRKKAELTVVDFRAPNKQGGRTFLYDVNICISIRADAEEKTKAILKDNDALIKDRIRTIIAESDPEKLGGGSEPGLETLRRQVKYQLDEIVGPDIIDEVLVPRCIPYPVNY
jgi:flagellar basal body-associated protein FliL